MADAPSATAVGGRSEQEDLPPARTRRDRPLLRFVLRRLAVTIGLLFGVVTVGFVLINAVPGDPLAIHLSPSALDNPEIVAAFEEKWGLNQPLWQQYLHYLNRLLHGDPGTSQRTGQPVLSNLMDVIPATVEIAIPALVIGVVLGTTFGILSALYRGKLLDQIVRIVALVGLSTPSFWLGLTLLYLFFYRFDLLPSGGRLSPEFEAPPERTGLYTVDGALHQDWTVVADAAWHLVLPVGVLAYLVSVIMVRFVRAAMLDVLGQDFIRAAHAKGLPRGVVIRRHLLRAGLVPVITMSGLMLATLLTGSVLVETIFSWPGLGQYVFQSAGSLDIPAVIGCSVLIGVVYTGANFLVDILYALADPRIRLS